MRLSTIRHGQGAGMDILESILALIETNLLDIITMLWLV